MYIYIYMYIYKYENLGGVDDVDEFALADDLLQRPRDPLREHHRRLPGMGGTVFMASGLGWQLAPGLAGGKTVVAARGCGCVMPSVNIIGVCRKGGARI